MHTLKVAIVGAGLGGLAAALALAREGVRADIYEQARELGDVGVGLHLASNGSRILRSWGLAEALAEAAVRPAALEVRDWNSGRTLTRQLMGDAWEESFGAPFYTVHRQDLHRLVAERIPPGWLHLDRRVTGFRDEDGADGVRLIFAGGGTAHADVLVGADGVHSVIRRAVAGPDAPVFSGTTAYRGLVPTDRLNGVPRDAILIWTGPASRLLCYPVREGRFLTFVAIHDAAGSRAESWSCTADPEEARSAFAGWAPEAGLILSEAGDVGRWALHDREPLTTWGSGRVTLLGDAAHPMLPHHGQGTSQAFEDAVVLAHCLSGSDGYPGDDRRLRIAAALRHYESIRRPHTARVQAASRDGGSRRLSAAGHRDPNGAMRSLVEDVSWIQRYDVRNHLTRPTGRFTMTSSEPGRRQLLRSTLGITAAAALGTTGLHTTATTPAQAGTTFPPVPGMLGDRRANELWYQFDEVTLVSQPQELKDAFAAVYSYIDQVGRGSIADIWLEMVKAADYPGNFTDFAAPIKPALEVVSRIQLGVFDAFYHPLSPRLVSAFSWFGQGVLYDPRRNEAHTMNGDPPRGYHTWHAYLRAMMFHGIDRHRWRVLAPRVALAWATQSTAKPDVTQPNPPLPRETVRRLAASWLPRTPERLDTDLQAVPYPWSPPDGGGR